MTSFRLLVCVSLFSLASSRRMSWEDQFRWFPNPEEFSHQQFPPPPADGSFRRHAPLDEFSFKPFPPVLPKNDPSWSEVDIIKLHYDCTGRLIREEAVKLKTRTGVEKFPEAELTNAPLSGHPEIAVPGSGNSKSENSGSGNSGSVTESEAAVTPMNFRSMKERFKIPKTTQRPEIGFEPDRIIDVPKLPCPVGQNEDDLGNCRPVFDDSMFQ